MRTLTLITAAFIVVFGSVASRAADSQKHKQRRMMLRVRRFARSNAAQRNEFMTRFICCVQKCLVVVLCAEDGYLH
jgi:hypothetical protein